MSKNNMFDLPVIESSVSVGEPEEFRQPRQKEKVFKERSEKRRKPTISDFEDDDVEIGDSSDEFDISDSDMKIDEFSHIDDDFSEFEIDIDDSDDDEEDDDIFSFEDHSSEFDLPDYDSMGFLD